ncbi:undecaprenyl-diphosphate phosphatase [Gordonia sp. X0973]|uniref:undecaprenyl-diphosphate phosphatase n=1 Tax=Gordonia sp. X0973 TaxID=2742602 RepID=UPI000F51F1FD|nr:undecaprenyl-diphosphate phosphatase [Gordonia sp. X0973]QKT07121.1 undecaprenyl-diphosphate phosphatase [Gordonia sp. X0973]
MTGLTYEQSVVMGLLQGVTELFPVSSLGHSLLVPAWLGGSWKDLVTQSAQRGHTPFMAFVVALHVATAVALIAYYWRDWVAVVSGFVDSIRHRRITGADAKMAWLLIVGTIPVGIVGLVAEKPLRTLFASPLAAAVFLTVNGGILLGAELLKRRSQSAPAGRHRHAGDDGSDITELGLPRGTAVGASQILALFPGISRSGVTISAGIVAGLDHERAAKFAFMLATPVILAAGALKIPELFGPDAHGMGGQVVVGAVCAFVAALASTAFLAKFFHTRTLYPFVAYCLIAGIASIIRFA